MKKLLSICMTLVLLCSLMIAPTFAQPKETFDIVRAKHALVKEAKEKVKQGNIIEKSNEEIDYMIAKMTSEGMPAEAIAQEMEKYGVYRLNLPEEVENRYFAAITTGSNDVVMSAPSIYLHYPSNQWIVSGGGNWITDNWTQYIPSTWPTTPTIGSKYNVGNSDAFGIGYTSISGAYTTKVNSVFVYISDGEGNEISTTSRSDGNGSLGAGFRLQDYIRLKKSPIYYRTPEYFSYVGKYFSCVARYDYNFADYNGIATSYYVHTYNTAVVQSVQFGASGRTAGVSVTVANQGYSFSAYSNDTRF